MSVLLISLIPKKNIFFINGTMFRLCAFHIHTLVVEGGNSGLG
ncbi:hypothetical protein MTBBW1_1980002 [Desulfamplus magnetovallimortis]|uniref:Uncharacterized protein n=1 Tax=Desulfamplus magnetovallimortis TaxID=1246637 RepID=A0A1W1HBC8_9BACT|nr:hypothetical protein MTBBW1_1980002 [Desulfamplus magnetovallimortis]